MIFTTYEFLLLYLPLTFIGYFILNKCNFYGISKIWLITASFIFYAQGSPDFFPYFLASVIGNFVVGSALSDLKENDKLQRKLLLLIGILANVFLLGYYKYMDFFIENVNALAGTDFTLKHIVLPIGISFFTFQLIAFLVDSARGETKGYNIMDYLLFITFFPQLIVGPIVHHKEMVHQFENKDNLVINYDNIAKGLFIFSIGCAKKMLFADPLTTDAQAFYANVHSNMPLLNAWFHSLEYTLSYYFDLSGYADMAIGMGWMFNIRIPQNFNSPYKAKDFQEYWKRWHMTLSKFLGDYIFRNVFRKNVKWRNYYIATMVTFFVSGFWHGSGWTFVLWGIINGLLVCVAAYRNRKNMKTPYVAGVAVTFFFVILTRVLFVSNTFSTAWNVITSMFHFSSLFGTGEMSFINQITSFVVNNQRMGLLSVLALAICWFTPNTREITDKYKPDAATLVYGAVLLTICILKMDRVVQFLYFQF
ncbi:MBOAT family O-acyltransferase [Anaeromicropila populeti]|uniref:D-alanyl-lipoteichoic acid acyltransferase DltB, MBOAT superfamily n=1 Tax=Anaeromicropila populeti TaxID=37658 RepID=A0A1I6J8D1_9FIRM|nr:MBOAT family O-acyltransferase [Anaeromicropila populeti]SFR75204.1 D-alanyl-lipoteichoic acid acyltransferase DltB, MBOAT superfamily [Anaeromicropila populeti]